MQFVVIPTISTELQMKAKILTAIVFLLMIISILFYCFFARYITIDLPFKCIYSTDYVFTYNQRIQKIHLTHDLRIYDAKSGYLLMNGYANSENQTYQIRRSILLNNIREKQDRTFQANIIKSISMENDTMPDALFNIILQEYQVGNDNLQLDIFHLHFQTWLIGGPYAFISVCQRY